MIKKISIVLFVLCTTCLQSVQVQAAVLSFDPPSQSVALGDPVAVDLTISGLGDDILTGYDIDVSFDASILGFLGFTVGPGPTGLDPFGFDFGGFSYGFESVAGTAAVGDLSFESDATLKAVQPDSFVLGTLNFSALSYGTSLLTISYALLAGAEDDFGLITELQAEVQTGSVSVVPVPAAIWLFGTGLIGLIGFSKRRQRLA